MSKGRPVIGIYSGTFDPVHKGHVAFARAAIKQCGLERVYLLVEPRPRRKQGVKAMEHRHAMVMLAIDSEPNLGSIITNQARFSVSRTLPVLQRWFEGMNIAFLMGHDMLNYFTDDDWPQIDDFVKAVELIIGVRGIPESDVRQQIKTIETTRSIRINYQLFRADQALASSSEIRQKLRKGLSPQELDPTVLKYIREQQLYASSDG